MIEIRKSQLIVGSQALINLGSGVLLSIFAISDTNLKVAAFLSGIILLRVAVFIEDKLEQVYG